MSDEASYVAKQSGVNTQALGHIETNEQIKKLPFDSMKLLK